jgi:hypothetical protein
MEKADTLRPHRPIGNAMDLESNDKLPYGEMYHLSEFELQMVNAYCQTYMPNEFIWRSSFMATAPILFGKKDDRRLRVCVNY